MIVNQTMSKVTSTKAAPTIWFGHFAENGDQNDQKSKQL